MSPGLQTPGGLFLQTTTQSLLATQCQSYSCVTKMPFDTIPITGANSVASNVVEVPSHNEINEKSRFSREGAASDKEANLGLEIKPVPRSENDSIDEKDSDDDSAIIITGADVAQHLIPLRDDFDPSLTFRSVFLASGLSAFQAVMSQIYAVSVAHSMPPVEAH